MSDSIKYIKRYSFITFTALGLTYVFLYWLKFDWKWLSDQFLIFLFSGIFGSISVLLVSEIMKYRFIKRKTEDFIYSVLLDLYRGFSYEIEYSIANIDVPNYPTPNTFYSQNAPRIIKNCQELRTVDYSLFKETVFYKQLNTFFQNEIVKIENHVHQSIGYLNTAINMLNYPQYSNYPNPTLTVLKKFKADAEIRKKALESILSVLSSTYPKRYSWDNDKKEIDSFKFDLNVWTNKSAEFFYK